MCSSTVRGLVAFSQGTMFASSWSMVQPLCPSWSWSPRLLGPFQLEPTKSTVAPAETNCCQSWTR
jgi:hypothetical protein